MAFYSLLVKIFSQTENGYHGQTPRAQLRTLIKSLNFNYIVNEG